MPELVEPYLGQVGARDDNPFSALNTAFLRDGVVRPCRRRASRSSEPIDVAVRSAAGDGKPDRASSAHPDRGRTQRRSARWSSVTSAAAPGTYFTNAVTEIVAGRRRAASITTRCSRRRPQAFHIATAAGGTGRGQQLHDHYVADLGGAAGPQRGPRRARRRRASSADRQRALYLVDGPQHVRQPHRHRPRQAALHQPRAVQGRPRRQGAASSTARSSSARTPRRPTPSRRTRRCCCPTTPTIDTQAAAGDLSPTTSSARHGATVGQLDETQLFYLRAAASACEARAQLLTFAFASDVIVTIRIEPVRDAVWRSSSGWLESPRACACSKAGAGDEKDSTMTSTMPLPSSTRTAARFDVERIRDDFPILSQTVHGKPLVYLDNAATTQKPQASSTRMRHYYDGGQRQRPPRPSTS